MTLKAQYDLDGHLFDSRTVLDESDPENPYAVGASSACSCGWTGTTEYRLDIEPGREDYAERSARTEWQLDHVTGLMSTTMPSTLAEQIRGIASELDALVEADRPMAALSAIRLSGGLFAEQARSAAQRASYLDHSWSEIGKALGVSKQAAWERYGKAPTPSS
ncbi:hypothetical protein [Streptomyces sp. NPDC088816]|uniref:hypothetical protein n=1 Tax=Streptomyces sp. NPDC088816 TaxID=3365906 RepID=UPI00380C0903